MAKGSALVGKLRGSAGNFTFSIVRGEQITKGKMSQQTNPSTLAQVVRRAKFRYLTLFYNMASDLLNHSFVTKKKKQTSRNAFFSKNMGSCPLVMKSQTTWDEIPDDGTSIYESYNVTPWFLPYNAQFSAGPLSNVNWSYSGATEGSSLGSTDLYLDTGVYINGTSMAVVLNYKFSDEDEYNDSNVANLSTLKRLAYILKKLGLSSNEMVTAAICTASYLDEDNADAGVWDYLHSFMYVRCKLNEDGAASTEYSSSDIKRSSSVLQSGTNYYVRVGFTTDNISDVIETVIGGVVIRSSYNSVDGWTLSDSYFAYDSDMTKYFLTVDNATEECLEACGYTIGELSELDPESV